MDQLAKQQAKYKKQLDAAFKKQWQQVRTKIRRIKIKRADKRILIEDAKHCNGDLMDVLVLAEQFTSVEDYFNTIAAYLKLEMESYDYKGVVLVYMPSKMKELVQIITDRHKRLDELAELKEKIGL